MEKPSYTLEFEKPLRELTRRLDELRQQSLETKVDLADQIVRLARSAAFGVYHATSTGQCTWHEFATAIFGEAGIDVVNEVATAADFPAKVRRPTYSVLDNRALRDRGLDVMPTWRDALKRYISLLRQEGRLPELAST